MSARTLSGEYSRGKVPKVVANSTDVSRNGCYVKQAVEAEPRFLHQAEALLSGSGLIGLGRAPLLNAAHTIRYTCLTEEDNASTQA